MNQNRIISMELKILNLLKERKLEGAYNYELSKIALNYTGVLSNLHRKGHVIQCKPISEGTNLYILHKETAEIKYYPSAWEDCKFHFHTTFNGCLNGDTEFDALFKMTGSEIKRKHGYYKDQMKAEYEEFQDQQMHFDLD